jgi:radical SAM protein with 4Fe4S-binding SPASM domain
MPRLQPWLAKGRAVLGIAHGRRAFGGPPQASVGLTNRCNIRCVHCYYYSPLLDTPSLREVRRARQQGREPPPPATLKAQQQADADPARVTRLVEELLAMGTRRFQWGGNGEPFLYPSLFSLIERVKRKNAFCFANTNGTLLTRSGIDELVRLGMDELRVTVMGGSRDVYDACHPGIRADTFARLTDSLLYLTDGRRGRGQRRPRLVTACIVVKQNCTHLMEFAEYSARVGADSVWYRPVDDVGDRGLAQLAPDSAAAAAARGQLAEVRLFLDARGIRHNVPGFLAAFERRLDTSALYRVIPCYYGWLATLIDVDGSVYPCCRCYEPMGNAFDSGMGAIWNSERYQAFREIAGARSRGDTPVPACACRTCVHHVANARVYRALHPLAARFGRLARIERTPSEGNE